MKYFPVLWAFMAGMLLSVNIVLYFGLNPEAKFSLFEVVISIVILIAATLSVKGEES